MDIFVEHFKIFYMYYIFGAIILAPLLFFTRHWTMPVILYSIELVIYWGLMHVSFFLLVILINWFKNETSMDRAFDRTSITSYWGTPLVEFWNRDAYSPSGVFWVEITFVVVIFLLVWRYRPMKTGNPNRRKKAAAAKKAAEAQKKGLLPATKPKYYND